MEHLSQLTCGQALQIAPAESPLCYLSGSLSRFSIRTLGLLHSQEDDDIIALGPFCSRVLLENSCAALVGRLDPFRLMYLGEYQNQSGYDPNKRYKAAFAWSGDVIADERAGPASWGPDHDTPKVSRSLFSKYMDHLCWRPAVERLLDVSQTKDGMPTEILDLDPERFIDIIRGRSIQLYSSLSKGVHWEFFSSSVQFDVSTVKSLMKDTYGIVSLLALVSHFVPTAYACLPPDSAIDSYLNLKGQLHG